MDISANAPSIHTEAALEKDKLVDLEIEDMEELLGKVARSFDDENAEYPLDQIASLDGAIRQEEL